MDDWAEANRLMDRIAVITMVMIGLSVILLMSVEFDRSERIAEACESYGYDKEIVQTLECE